VSLLVQIKDTLVRSTSALPVSKLFQDCIRPVRTLFPRCVPVMSVSKYQDISTLNNASASNAFLGRCMHSIVSPLGGNSTRWKVVVRFVGKDPKKYVLITSFFEGKQKAEQQLKSVKDGTVKKISKVTLDTKCDKKYISSSVKQGILLNGKGVTTLLVDVPVADTDKIKEMATHIVPGMDLHKILKEHEKKSSLQKEAFIDFVATIRQQTDERPTDKGVVGDFELIDVSGKAGSRLSTASISAWQEHATFLKDNVGKACMFLHIKLSNGSSKLETSHGCSIILMPDNHPMKVALDEAYTTYKTDLPEDAVQVTKSWEPGSNDLNVDTSGRQPLFCAAALRANMLQMDPDIDGKKVSQFHFLMLGKT
jgi:hypothetical protein